jgi:D-arabinose 1-dehydrogenase-like Zn-dependent alcohol dehydrogenase
MIASPADAGRAAPPEAVRSGIHRRVLVGAFAPCGECEVCRRGGAPVCPQATRVASFPPRFPTMGRWLVALGDGLELPLPAAAAVAGDVALAYTLYARTGLGPREPVVVTGATSVTRFLIEILIAKRIAPVVLAEPGAWADELAAKGAVVAASRDAIAAGFAAQGLGARPWRVIASAAEMVATAAALCGPRATLTALAPVAQLPGELVAREVAVIGVADAHPELVIEAAAMCVKGEIDLAGGVSTVPDPTRTLVGLVSASR